MIESILLTTYQTQFFHKFMRALNVLLKRSESIKTLVREKDSLALLRSSNLEALAIVLDNTALEAARRYQWFILEHTDKGWHSNYDIFAGIGAERALAHVLCNQSEVNEALLLKGLVVDDVDSLGALIDDASIVNEAFHRRDGGGSPVKQAQRAACSDAYTKLGQMPEGYNPYWATIDKNDLGDYSSFIDHWGNTRPSLLKFISGRRGYVVERLFYLGGAEEDWDLTVFNFKGADFSNTVCIPFCTAIEGVEAIVFSITIEPSCTVRSTAVTFQ